MKKLMGIGNGSFVSLAIGQERNGKIERRWIFSLELNLACERYH